MATEAHIADNMFEDDAFAASQSLEEELMGKGYMMETPMGSSLAAELQSAIVSNDAPTSKLKSLALSRSLSSPLKDDGIINAADDGFASPTSPLVSPVQLWASASSGLMRSRRSSFSSTWSSLDADDDDPFEMLKRQLEDLNSAVWETKTLHKRMLNTLSLDDPRKRLESNGSDKYMPSIELIITSVINLIGRKSRDRDRQTSYLRSLDASLRKEAVTMTAEACWELENLVTAIRTTLHDQQYEYDNPLPLLRKLSDETTAVAESLDELKELMYVNKHQVQELNQRLRSIAKTVHEVRKDIRKINKFLEEKDDDDSVVLERGEVETRVQDILWGLDDLEQESAQKLKEMRLFWETLPIATPSS